MKKILVTASISSTLFLSGCIGGLPKCDSQDAKNTIQQIINSKKFMVGEFVEITHIEETAFNKDSEIRVCTGLLTTTKTTEEISYSIKWQNKENNQFWLEIN